jgi:hypothetical protein
MFIDKIKRCFDPYDDQYDTKQINPEPEYQFDWQAHEWMKKSLLNTHCFNVEIWLENRICLTFLF